MTDPIQILRNAIGKVPFVKYALGVAGIAAAIAIIKSFGIENYSTIPIISILVMLGFMVLLFLFSTLTRSKEKPLKLAGYILVYTTVLITCVSSTLLTTSVFFDKPKPITDYSIFPKDKTDSSVSKKEVDKALAKKDVDKVPIKTKQNNSDSTPLKVIETKNGFFKTSSKSAYILYDGTKISFKKVIGNYTKLSYPISPYYISEPLPNKILAKYASSNSCRTSIPSDNLINKPIETIFFDDAEGIAKMLKLDIPNMVQIVNADLSGRISLGNHQELFYQDSSSFGPSSLGEIYITQTRPNILYLAEKYHATVIPNVLTYRPRGQLRLVKNIR